MLLTGRNGLLDIIILIPAILLALTVHEFAHAWVAWKLGDQTAWNLGRVSLNPIVHLDIMGTIVLVLTGFIGWAKPVPVDSTYFKNPRKDMALVAAAGPAANIVTAVFFILALLLFTYAYSIFGNLLPIPIQRPLVALMVRCLIINLAFAFMNLIPIHPLDGFNIIAFFLPLSVIFFCLRYRYFFMVALLIFFWKGPFFDIFNQFTAALFKLLFS
ncbi:MAG: site-2 protease family protein [Deltaproteobacteria bacterium]|jgi:Zn-dependent protease|nr:site-2 protease family protein [Deltaproteobacteria bacterium]